jgi:hypothetical protein
LAPTAILGFRSRESKAQNDVCHSWRIGCRKFGKRANRQALPVHSLAKGFIEPREEQLDGMYLPIEKAERVLRLSLEGNSASNVLSASRKFISPVLR